MLSRNWWGTLLSGIAGILIALITSSQPRSTAIVLIYYSAAWAALTGIFHIAAGIQLRRVRQYL